MPLGQFAIAALIGLGPYAKLPLHFEANHGQTDSRVKFLARGHGYTLFLTPSEAVLVATHASKDPDSAMRGRVVRMQFLNAAAAPTVAGRDELAGKAHYLMGNDPKRWRTHVPTYGRVQYRGVYPGIDLVFYGQEGQLEYDFILAPGADPRTIGLHFENAERLELDAEGDLVLHTPGGRLRQHKPVAYQDVDGTRTPVPARFQIREGNQVAFLVAAHDASRPLIIDPKLEYSTYVGGSGGDALRSLAVDSAGSAYVSGTTSSLNFPVAGAPFQGSYGGGIGDAFVAKLNPSGSGLVYATYLGGSADETANALAIDDGGRVHLTGFTTSGDFPTRNPIQATFGGPPFDAFVSKLTAGGDALVFSTYLGGVALDVGNGIAVDRDGEIYVSLRSGSPDLPVTPGAFQTTFGGVEDAAVAKLKRDGSRLRYLTYLGGSGMEVGRRIAVDRQGRAHVSGSTRSTDFPTTPRAVQTTFGGGLLDAFVTKLNASGSALVYSTYLGGSGDDEGSGIGLDGDGDVISAGWTGSADFPTTAGAFQTVYGGGVFDVFVTKLSEHGSRLVYSTFLGGSGSEMSFFGLAVDRGGRAHVTGTTQSTNFPLARPLDGGDVLHGSNDAFVAKFNARGSRLRFSTYLGGSATEGSQGIDVDRSGNIYVAGASASADFPTTEGAFQTTFAGGPNDATVVKIRQRHHDHGHGHGHDDDEDCDEEDDYPHDH